MLSGKGRVPPYPARHDGLSVTVLEPSTREVLQQQRR